MTTPELTELSTLRDLKFQNTKLKFKLTTVNCYVTDIKIMKNLIIHKIIISMAEMIRAAIYHYLFFEELVLRNDSNQGQPKAKTNRKSTIGFHISNELVALIEERYGENHCLAIRQMLHAFLTRFNMSREV